MPQHDRASANRAALDWLSFLLADVQGGIGPFLAVYLTAARHWTPGQAGLVLTTGGLATVLARAPAGALLDRARAKRGLIAAAALLVAAASVMTAAWPRFWPVLAGQIANGVADALFPAAISAVSLGIAGHAGFTARVGRNEAFNHLGNVATALITGIAGTFVAPQAVLWGAAALAVAVLWPLAAIRSADIDHAVARGADRGDAGLDDRRGWRLLLRNHALATFIAAITLFHFANAAMLPLVGEKLARAHQHDGPLFLAACIMTAQAAMVPMAVLVGRHADRWGRKPIFLAGFAALPVRGVLYTLVQSPSALIAIQLLDGIGAGIFGALFFIVVADLTAGSGRYNLAQGVAAAAWGLGAALSNAVAGCIVDNFGFDVAFLFLSACALAALVTFWLAVPETAGWARRARGVPVPAV
jgi:MFS family permease